ncbi:universal stress protein [Motiliproteus coralliicola]|nr:universal stress protein [Motiliproteus coralliicola]
MNGFTNILYFADGELSMTPALQRAIRLAYHNQATLTLMDVADRLSPNGSLKNRLKLDINEIVQRFHQQSLSDLISGVSQLKHPIGVKVASGWGFIEVIREVMRGSYDLLIKSARYGCHQGLSSSDMHLLRKCPCPVWIDRAEAATPYRRILVAVDPNSEHQDDCADRALELGSWVAGDDGSRLVLVHAWELPGESMMRSGLLEFENHQLESLLAEARLKQELAIHGLLERHQLTPAEVDVQLRKGPPAEVIHDVSEELSADLVVMGTVGRTGIPGFIIGNTAEDVLQSSGCSVLAVKPSGFVSPVEPE